MPSFLFGPLGSMFQLSRTSDQPEPQQTKRPWIDEFYSSLPEGWQDPSPPAPKAPRSTPIASLSNPTPQPKPAKKKPASEFDELKDWLGLTDSDEDMQLLAHTQQTLRTPADLKNLNAGGATVSSSVTQTQPPASRPVAPLPMAYGATPARPTQAPDKRPAKDVNLPAPKGLLYRGNIDLDHRTPLKNPDGSISTLRSISINVDGKEVLIPTVTADGKSLTKQQAIDHYRKTGDQLGIFDTAENATAYAQQLHESQAKQYAPAPRQLTEQEILAGVDQGPWSLPKIPAITGKAPAGDLRPSYDPTEKANPFGPPKKLPKDVNLPNTTPSMGPVVHKDRTIADSVSELFEREPTTGAPMLSKKGEALIPWVGGLSGAVDMFNLVRAARRVRDGKGNAADQQALEDFYSQQLHDSEPTSVGYKIANVVENLPPFAIEMLMTGGAYDVTKEATLKAGRAALTKLVSESAEKAMKSRALRAGGEVAGWVAGSAAQEAAMFPRVAQATGQALAPNLRPRSTEEEDHAFNQLTSINVEGDKLKTAFDAAQAELQPQLDAFGKAKAELEAMRPAIDQAGREMQALSGQRHAELDDARAKLQQAQDAYEHKVNAWKASGKPASGIPALNIERASLQQQTDAFNARVGEVNYELQTANARTQERLKPYQQRQAALNAMLQDLNPKLSALSDMQAQAKGLAEKAAPYQRTLSKAGQKSLRDVLQDWDDDFLPALMKGVASQFVEVASERTGDLPAEVAAYFRGTRAGSAVTEAAAPVAQRIAGMKAAVLDRWLKLSPKNTLGGFLEKVKKGAAWNGTLGEIFEERVGDVMKDVMVPGGDGQSATSRLLTGQTRQPEQEGEQLSANARVQAAHDLWNQLLVEAPAFAVPGVAHKLITAIPLPNATERQEPKSPLADLKLPDLEALRQNLQLARQSVTIPQYAAIADERIAEVNAAIEQLTGKPVTKVSPVVEGESSVDAAAANGPRGSAGAVPPAAPTSETPAPPSAPPTSRPVAPEAKTEPKQPQGPAPTFDPRDKTEYAAPPLPGLYVGDRVTHTPSGHTGTILEWFQGKNDSTRTAFRVKWDNGETTVVNQMLDLKVEQVPASQRSTAQTLKGYHGSAEIARRGTFEGFDLSVDPSGRAREVGSNVDSMGTWWTSSRADAEHYGRYYGEDGKTLQQGAVVEGEVTLQNPRVFESPEEFQKFTDGFRKKTGTGRAAASGADVRAALEADGYDGLIVRGGGKGDATPEGGDFYLSFENKGVKAGAVHLPAAQQAPAKPAGDVGDKKDNELTDADIAAALAAELEGGDSDTGDDEAPARPTGSRWPEITWRADLKKKDRKGDPTIGLQQTITDQHRRVQLRQEWEEKLAKEGKKPEQIAQYKREIADLDKRIADTWGEVERRVEGVDLADIRKRVEAGEWVRVMRPRRNPADAYSLEDDLSHGAQENIDKLYKRWDARNPLALLRSAMELYENLRDRDAAGDPEDDTQGDEEAAQIAERIRDAAERAFANPDSKEAGQGWRDLSRAEYDARQHLGIDRGDTAEGATFADAEDAGQLIYGTLDPRTASFDIEEFNTADGMVEFRRDPAKVFPAPKERVNMRGKDAAPYMTDEEAAAKLEEWKAQAKADNNEDNSNKVIISLFDRTGIISQPWRDAGYHVVQYDIRDSDDRDGTDLTHFGKWMGEVEGLIGDGMEIVGIIGQPPCTSFTNSGSRWWDTQHDKEEQKNLEKKYGFKASEEFERPIDYANTLVAVVKLIVAQANPNFYVMENPLGRIRTQNHLPQDALAFDPHNFGDVIITDDGRRLGNKETHLWGEFNPHLPQANVESTPGDAGSRSFNQTGFNQEDKDERSETSIPFAYALYMANRELAQAQWKGGPDQQRDLEGDYEGGEEENDSERDEDEAQEPPPVISFRSGNQKAPADIAGYIKAGQDVGVTALGMTGPVRQAVVDHVANGGNVFVDSGAFGKTKVVDGKGVSDLNFDAVLSAYEKLADDIEEKNENASLSGLHVVAPDVAPAVVDGQMRSFPDETKALQKQYGNRIAALAERGLTVIVPVQVGPDMADNAAEVATEWANFWNVRIGLPGNMGAISDDQLTEMLDGMVEEGVTPNGFHFLGIGEKNQRLQKLVDRIRETFPNAYITSDSNRTRAIFGEGRPGTKRAAERLQELAEEQVDSEWESDTTEMLGDFGRGDFDNFTPNEMERLAKSLGKTVAEVKAAYDERKDGHDDEDSFFDWLMANGDRALDLEMYQIAKERGLARKGNKAQARTDTIAEIDKKKEAPESQPAESRPVPVNFMNEADIERAVERFKDHPVLGPAARFLEAFKDEVNAHSDGWPYWKQPHQAAAKLQTLLYGHLMGGMGAYPKLPEPTVSDVTDTLPPIKSFMTRLGKKAGMKLPELEFPKEAYPAPGKVDASREANEEEIRAEIAALEAKKNLTTDEKMQLVSRRLDLSVILKGRRRRARDQKLAKQQEPGAPTPAAEAAAGWKEGDTVRFKLNGKDKTGEIVKLLDLPTGMRVATVRYGTNLETFVDVRDLRAAGPAYTWGHAAAMSQGAAAEWFANMLVDDKRPIRVRAKGRGEGWAEAISRTSGKDPFVIVMFDSGQELGVSGAALEPAWSGGDVVRRDAKPAESQPVSTPSAPQDSAREALINKIAEAAREPEPDVTENFELKATDGKWYRPNGFPLGVSSVKPIEKRSTGWTILTRDNTTVGKSYPTKEELLAAIRAREDKKVEEFKGHLREMDDERLRSQEAHWLHKDDYSGLQAALRGLAEEGRHRPKPRRYMLVELQAKVARHAGNLQANGVLTASLRRDALTAFKGDQQALETAMKTHTTAPTKRAEAPKPDFTGAIDTKRVDNLVRDGVLDVDKDGNLVINEDKFDAAARGKAYEDMTDAELKELLDIGVKDEPQKAAAELSRRKAAAKAPAPGISYNQMTEQELRALVKSGTHDQHMAARDELARRGGEARGEAPKSEAQQKLDAEKAKNRAEREALMKELKAKLNRIGANTPLDPEIVAIVVKIARSYVRDGVRKFQEAALAFREEFGEHAKAETYFEFAWPVALELADGKTLKEALAIARAQKNRPTVADAVRAYTEERGTDDRAEGRDGDRSGQSPEPGGAAPDAIRDGDQGSLGAVPAETGSRTEGAGADSTGRSDQEGASPADVSGSTDAGEAPGAAPGSGGRDVPAGGVPAAGSGSAQGIRGIKPEDYTLTPERIAGIINRGNVQRLKDNVAAIRLVKDLQTENRYPTPAEQEQLAKYVGWGATDIQEYLEESPRHGWSANEKGLWQELRDLTTEQQRKELKRSSPNAHFTFDLYRPIWSALEWFGFKGGRVLEPAVGVGHALGFMPPAIRKDSTINASELDPMTAAMAGYLYPSARVQPVGYESIRLPRNTQDLAISNVPFGRFGVDDPLFSGALKFVTEKIHSYFFAKAMEHVRPGGYVVFVTSRYTMDGPEHANIRRHLMSKAHFVGAVRLPGGDKGAFVKSAKTQVVSDVIVLQKRREDEDESRNADLFIQSPKQEHLSTPESKDRRGRKVPARNVYRSAWYDKHPQFIIGTEGLTGSQYSANEYGVEAPKDQDVQEALETALKVILPKDAYDPASTTSTEETPATVEGDFKPGELRVGPKNTIQRALLDGSLVDATPRKKDGSVDVRTVQRIVGLIAVRDARRAVIAAMRSSTATTNEIKKLQGALQRAYDKFIKEFGGNGKSLNSIVNRQAFKSDPEAAAVRALEVLKTTAKVYKDKDGNEKLRVRHEVDGLADIFTKRTINAPAEISHVDTPREALLASLGVHGRINWQFIARITGDGRIMGRVTELQEQLKGDGDVFEQPDGTWVTRDEYLSGDVVTKLADAEAAEEQEPGRFKGNVEALKAIQPAPKTANDIQIPLGAHWINPQDFGQFVDDSVGMTSPLYKTQMTLDGTAQYVRWNTSYPGEVVARGTRHPLAVRYGPAGRDGLGTDIYSFTELLDDLLNMKQPTLGYYVTDANNNRVFIKQEKETLAARANLEELRTLWTTWIYSHPEPLARAVEVYNTRYNRTIKREFDGSHLANYVNEKGEPTRPEDGGKRSAALPGLALPFSLYPHQLRAVWRVLTSGNTLLAHEVGAGKTFEMIVAAMEMRRTGRARKPMITVPTYLLAQWRKDILKAYPDAKLLAFEEKDLESGKRQEAMARIAHGDWDIVLVPHSSFQLLKVSNERMASTLQEWIDEIQAAEDDARALRGGDDESVKKLEEARRRIEDKARKIMARVNKGTDNAMTWEQLGVDALLVDEAHAFKNLYFFSKIDNVRGLSRSSADKSLDMFIKVKDINEASNYRNLVFATATPVMNSLAEVYTMQRYLQPQRLRDMGFENFDNWYNTFAQAKVITEQKPDGSYHEVTRVAKFRNGKLLYRIASEIMDYVGWEHMPYLDLPKLKNGKITLVQGEPHPMYDTIRQWFTRRMAAIKATPPHYDKFRRIYVAPERHDPITDEPMGRPDNILTIMNDAKLAAIDARLVLGNHAADTATSRVQTAAKMVADYYKREAAKKGVALIFLDVGTPTTTEPLEFLKGVTVDDETGGDALGVEEEEVDPDDEDAAALSSAEFNGNFNLYDAVKKALIARGVKSEEIAFIHQARNAAERLALFQAAQEGKIRVLLASTEKGGLGMNIQDRLGMIVEMDAPRAMRPGDIRQRHGRGIRQGNSYKTLEILRFVTKGTTDEWLYGLLNKKQGMITDFMNGELDEFEDKDISSMTLNDLEEAEAHATGDSRKLELLELRASLPRLEAQAAAAAEAAAAAQADVEREKKSLPLLETRLKRIAEWVVQKYQKLSGDDFSIKIGDETYTKRADANKALIDALKPLADKALEADQFAYGYGQRAEWSVVGEIGNVPILARPAVDRHDYTQGVEIGLDLDAIGDGEEHVSAIIAGKSGKAVGTFGEGRNLIATLTDRYAGLPLRARGLETSIASAKERVARAEQLLANPSDAPQRVAKAKARIEAIEAEMLAESAIKEREAAAALAEAQRERNRRAQERAAKAGGGGDASVGEYSKDAFDTTQPTKNATVNGQTIRPMEFPELVRLATELQGAPSVVRRFRGDADGMFTGFGGIKLRADLFKPGGETQLAAVLAHEIGHLADWLPDNVLKRGNILGHLRSLKSFLKGKYTAQDGTTVKNAEVRDELKKLSAMWRPWDRDEASASLRKYRDSAKELYADALSVLLNNPGLLEAEAPIFHKEFFAELDAKPEVKRAYFELQALLSGTRDELVDRRLENFGSMFTLGDTKAMELERQRRAKRDAESREWRLKFMTQLVDKHTPFIDRVKQLEKTGHRINPEENPVYLLEERNYISGRLKGWLQRNIDPLFQVMNESGIGWETFGKALAFERIIDGDRGDIANPQGHSPASAREMYDRMKEGLSPQQLETLADAIEDFRAAVKDIAREAHRVGIYSDETWKRIEANKAYATFQTIEHLKDPVGVKIYNQIGTLKDITNPANATIIKTILTLRAIEHQKVKVASFNFLHKYFGNEIEQAREVRLASGGSKTVPPNDGRALVTYYERGRIRGKYVDPYIGDSLENNTIGDNWIGLKTLSLANNKFFRPVFTTVNAGFQAFNVIRDFLRFWKSVPQMWGLGRAIKRYWEAVPIARVRAFGLKEKPSAADMKAWEELLQAEEAGILSITFSDYMKGQDVEDTQIADILAKHGVHSFEKKRNPVVRAIKALTDPIAKVGDFFETLPKAAGMYEFKGSGSISEIPADLRNHIRTKLGSPDFLAGGTAKPVTNNVLLFSNAIVQAWRADIDTMTAPKTRSGYWWKTALVNFAPKMLSMAALAGAYGAMAGGGDDKLQRLMRRVTEYDLTNYTIVPLGEDEQGNTIYIRLPQDDTGRFLGGLLWKAMRLAAGDRATMTTLANVVDYTHGQFPGFSPLLSATGSAIEYASGRNPYDAFRGRFLLTDDEQKARGFRAHMKFLGWEFQQLGGGIIWKFYPGEERPEKKTLGQKIVDLPLVSNVVGRFVRITNYGETERARAAGAEVEAARADRRLSEGAAVNAKVREYLDQTNQSVASRDRHAERAAKEIAKELYPTEKKADHDATIKRLTRRLKLSMVRGTADSLGDAVLAARSNEEKIGILLESRKDMPHERFERWLLEAAREGVVSPPLMVALRKKMRNSQ